MSNACKVASQEQIPAAVRLSLRLPDHSVIQPTEDGQDVRLYPEITEDELHDAPRLDWHEDKDELDENWSQHFAETGPFQLQLANPKEGEEALGWRLLIFINFLPVDVSNLGYQIPIAYIQTMVSHVDLAKRLSEVFIARWMNRRYVTDRA